MVRNRTVGYLSIKSNDHRFLAASFKFVDCPLVSLSFRAGPAEGEKAEGILRAHLDLSLSA